MPSLVLPFFVFPVHKLCPREAQEKPTKGFTEIIYSVAALKEELGFVFVSLINLHLELFREVVFSCLLSHAKAL